MNTNYEWKFKVGDFVTPIVHDDYEHRTRMVITARVIEEYAQHIEYWYVCSHFKLGDYVRLKHIDTELAPYVK